jgi:hypothetical protein
VPSGYRVGLFFCPVSLYNFFVIRCQVRQGLKKNFFVIHHVVEAACNTTMLLSSYTVPVMTVCGMRSTSGSIFCAITATKRENLFPNHLVAAYSNCGQTHTARRLDLRSFSRLADALSLSMLSLNKAANRLSTIWL